MPTPKIGATIPDNIPASEGHLARLAAQFARPTRTPRADIEQRIDMSS